MCLEQMVAVNGVNLWSTVQGGGLPIVLCHGGPGAYDCLEPVAEMIDDLCQVIRYDQRGGGRSSESGPYNVSTFVEDLDSLRKHYAHERWIVAGHSWGAGLALAHAVRFPAHTTAVIHISGTGIDPKWHEEYRKNRLAVLSEAERNEYTRLRSEREEVEGVELERMEKRLTELSRRADVCSPDHIGMLPQYDLHPTSNDVNREVGSDWSAYQNDPAFHKAVHRLRMPILFVHGAADSRPAHFIEKLSSLVQNGCYRAIEESGHYPWVERPEDLKKILREFLVEHS